MTTIPDVLLTAWGSWTNLLRKATETVGYHHACRTGFADPNLLNLTTPPASLVGLNAIPAEPPSSANICIGYQSCATPVTVGMTNKRQKFPKKKRIHENFRTVRNTAKYQHHHPIHQPRSQKAGFTVKKTQRSAGKSHSHRC